MRLTRICDSRHLSPCRTCLSRRSQVRSDATFAWDHAYPWVPHPGHAGFGLTVRDASWLVALLRLVCADEGWLRLFHCQLEFRGKPPWRHTPIGPSVVQAGWQTRVPRLRHSRSAFSSDEVSFVTSVFERFPSSPAFDISVVECSGAGKNQQRVTTKCRRHPNTTTRQVSNYAEGCGADHQFPGGALAHRDGSSASLPACRLGGFARRQRLGLQSTECDLAQVAPPHAALLLRQPHPATAFCTQSAHQRLPGPLLDLWASVPLRLVLHKALSNASAPATAARLGRSCGAEFFTALFRSFQHKFSRPIWCGRPARAPAIHSGEQFGASWPKLQHHR